MVYVTNKIVSENSINPNNVQIDDQSQRKLHIENVMVEKEKRENTFLFCCSSIIYRAAGLYSDPSEGKKSDAVKTVKKRLVNVIVDYGLLS